MTYAKGIAKYSVVIFFVILSGDIRAQKKIPFIVSDSSMITYRLNGQRFDWKIDPKINPDQKKIICYSNNTIIQFITNKDSIKFNVLPNTTYRFGIILQKDTAYSYFKRFSDHKAVKAFDSLLANDPYYGFYNRDKMNSCGYVFRGGIIRKNGIYDRLAWDDFNNLDAYIPVILDFAKKSNFRKYFAKNKTYYDSLIKAYNQSVPVADMWKWLEQQFPYKYDSYKITFSPLTWASHSTNHFEDNSFKETVMFITSSERSTPAQLQMSDGLWSANQIRVVFTEIDHNYVNPHSNLHASEINAALSDIKKWNTAQQGYSDPVSTFNEYMTWAAYTLYIHDKFPADVFTVANQRVERFMVQTRGFLRFKEFNQKLLDEYKNKKTGTSVADLYAKIIDWCKAFN